MHWISTNITLWSVMDSNHRVLWGARFTVWCNQPLCQHSIILYHIEAHYRTLDPRPLRTVIFFKCASIWWRITRRLRQQSLLRLLSFSSITANNNLHTLLDRLPSVNVTLRWRPEQLLARFPSTLLLVDALVSWWRSVVPTHSPKDEFYRLAAEAISFPSPLFFTILKHTQGAGC